MSAEAHAILQAAAALDPGAAALVTVVSLHGSGYRRPGARMLVAADGELTGCVSGGCLESDAALHALAAIQDGRTRLVTYDTTDPDDVLLGVGLGCRGVVRVLIEPVATPGCQAFLAHWAAAMAGGPALLVAQVLEVEGAIAAAPGDRVLWAGGRLVHADLADPVVLRALGDEARADRVVLPEGSIAVAWQTVEPPPLLWICGAGIDAPAMARTAVAAGFRVEVRDHRSGYALQGRFPAEARVVAARPEPPEAERPWGAILMTHNYEADRAWLTALRDVPLAYLGMLGPRRRALGLLAELGVAEPPACLHAPIGLDIGAETPDEVAIAAVAEIKAVLAGRPAGFLRDKDGPIHQPPGTSVELRTMAP